MSIDAVLARAKRMDRAMAWVVSAGGVLIIAAVLGILVFIFREAWPLFAEPKAHFHGQAPLHAADALLVDESGSALVTVSATTGLAARTLQGSHPLPVPAEGPSLPWKAMTPIGADGTLTVLDAQGRLHAGHITWDKSAGEQDPATWSVKASWLGGLPCGLPVDRLLHGRYVAEGLGGGGTLHVLATTVEGLWVGVLGTERTPQWQKLPLAASTALFLNDGAQVLVGTPQGEVALVETASTAILASITFGEPITTLGFVLGHTSIIAGGAQGRLAAFQVLHQEGRHTLQQLHAFQPMGAAVRGVMHSLRDKRFLVWSDQDVAVDHLTTERRLFHAPRLTRTAALSPRGEHIFVLGSDQQVGTWLLDAPHPEISWKTLWSKVHYESYEKPEHVWQSSGGGDDFEPKLSLVPLLFGTLKGTLYAMIFALPLAVFGALYTSQFATPRIRGLIKPTLEIMAALPSVVLGFLAGLILAPLFERSAIHVLLLPACALIVALLILPLWTRLPQTFRNGWVVGREAVWIIPVLLLAFLLTAWVAPWVESTFLGGDFRAWLLTKHGLTYDQRNALVVGFAMGFAVIPIIFTLSEDALSSVPKSLTSASLACGASPWQTAWRVVLPTGSPGIFSATMVGFGRAIGETMIVLMATGNTPVLDWMPFNGMRTLSANIATEALEAPVGGTLYRVLFLTALLLFALTFLLNTVAELIRQHLRKRYETF